MILTLIDVTLFAMMVLTAFAIVRMDRLFAVVMLAGVFSLLSAMLLVTLDAVDVAFTEAAVGAGMSTVLMLSTISLTARREKPSRHSSVLPLLISLITGAVLIYGTLDMPNFGDPNAPANLHVAPAYLKDSIEQIDIPNVVTAILASYRGYDTLGETAVVFTAGIGVLLLISGLGRRRREDEDEEEDDDDNDNEEEKEEQT